MSEQERNTALAEIIKRPLIELTAADKNRPEIQHLQRNKFTIWRRSRGGREYSKLYFIHNELGTLAPEELNKVKKLWSMKFALEHTHYKGRKTKTNKKTWSTEELTRLGELHKTYGFDWPTIVKFLPGRSISAAKYNYYKNIRPKKSKQDPSSAT